jgi:hypothetical protein
MTQFNYTNKTEKAYTQFIYSNRNVYMAIAQCSSLLHSPTGKLISTWAQVDPNDIICSQTFLCDQVGDNLIANIAWQLEV